MNLKIHTKSLFDDIRSRVVYRNLFFKFTLAMKLTTLLIFIASIQISAKSFSQKITLNLKKSSLNEVLQEIRKQSGYKLVYNTDLLVKAKPVSINVKEATVDETLKIALTNQPFKYNIQGETILINPDTKPVENNLPKNEAKQLIPVSGRIVDDKGEPLPGASVTEKGTKNYAMANNNGEFKINITRIGATLIFSSIGYISHEAAAEANMKVTLKSNVQSLSDVVITGYQQIKKESLTGSVTKIKASDIQVASMGTLDKMLQGQVAGVAVETASAVFGTAPKIRVRGSSSLSGINEPLWVLDGVPLEAPLNIAPSELYSGGARNLLASALSGVNPEDIDDITVLRDATATAMYGTRAVNGVIVITTKRARKNMALSINYSTNGTLTLKPSITDFDVLNSYEQTVLNEQIFKTYQNSLMSFSAQTSGAYSKLIYDRNVKSLTDEQFRAQVRDLKTINTDWFDYLYKNSFMQQHSVSASYGGENAFGRLSVSYYDDLGKTIGEKVKRYTVNLTSGYQLNKNLSADFMIKYSNRNQNNPGTQVNPFIYARDASRNMRPYDIYGNPEYYKRGYTDFNIIEEINNNYIRLNNSDFLAQVDVKYKFTDNLKLNGLFNTRVANNDVNEIQTEFSNYANQFRQMGIIDPDGFLLSINDRNPRLYRNPANALYLPTVSVLPEGGILDRETTTSKFYTGRLQLEWNALNNFKGHNITALAGAEITSNEQNGYFNRGYGYLSSSRTTTPNYLALQRLIQATELPEDERRMYNGRNLLAGTNYYYTEYNRHTVSYYTNISYNYKSKYVVDLSLRNDAANITSSRFTPTWAAGISWNLSNENFMKPIEQTLSNVKLRASYGLRGNDGARGPALVAYLNNITRVYPAYNTTAVGILEPENTDLQFEKEHILNAGVDFTLFQYADVSANVYRRNNFDLLGNRQVAPSLGYSNKTFNWANMRNQGVELSINLRPVKLVSDLRLNMMFNAAYNKNEVLSDLTGSNPTIFQIATSRGYAMEGGPVSGLYAFKFAGLSNDGLPQYYNGKGEVVSTFVANSTNIKDLEYQGSRDPKYSGGFTPTLRYKNMSLSAAFVFNAGHVVRLADFYRGGSITSLFRDDQNTPGDFAYRWTAPGDEKYTVIPRLITDTDIENYNNAGFFNESIFTAYNYNNMRTVNASYLRFRNLNFQYSFPELSRKLRMQNFAIALEASNIAIWTSKRLKGQDPETLLGGLNIPPVKSFTISLNASF
jgi:TonB-linked SusC/RagA family outer membrane protein